MDFLKLGTGIFAEYLERKLNSAKLELANLMFGEKEARKSEIVEQQLTLSNQGYSVKNINACYEFKRSDPMYSRGYNPAGIRPCTNHGRFSLLKLRTLEIPTF